MSQLKKKPLFNPLGDTDVLDRRMIGGNTTNLNDFNNMKYEWVSDWYRQAMNNFWIPEEINLGVDIKDYRKLPAAERRAYDKILSFLIFLDSLQSANLPAVGEYITANEVNLCLAIQTFQETVHSQSYSYMLDTICEPQERNDVLYQWKEDEHLLARNEFIGNLYNQFQDDKSPEALARVLVDAPQILILDEATANIDSGTEQAIQHALAAIRPHTTLVVIAHRLSTIVEADTILVLHRGQAVERGSHQALLEARGRYWQMYQLQLAGEELQAAAKEEPLSA